MPLEVAMLMLEQSRGAPGEELLGQARVLLSRSEVRLSGVVRAFGLPAVEFRKASASISFPPRGEL